MSLCVSNTTSGQKVACDKTNYFWANLSSVEPREYGVNIFRRGKVLNCACGFSWHVHCHGNSGNLSRLEYLKKWYFCLFTVWGGKRWRGMEVCRDLIWENRSDIVSETSKLFLLVWNFYVFRSTALGASMWRYSETPLSVFMCRTGEFLLACLLSLANVALR